jgi:hypothetical protein
MNGSSVEWIRARSVPSSAQRRRRYGNSKVRLGVPEDRRAGPAAVRRGSSAAAHEARNLSVPWDGVPGLGRPDDALLVGVVGVHPCFFRTELPVGTSTSRPELSVYD